MNYAQRFKNAIFLYKDPQTGLVDGTKKEELAQLLLEFFEVVESANCPDDADITEVCFTDGSRIRFHFRVGRTGIEVTE